jgi:hypothetical protein
VYCYILFYSIALYCALLALIQVNLFCASASIPYLVEREQKNEKEFVVFCPEALSDTGKVGNMGCLAWKGDILKMSR